MTRECASSLKDVARRPRRDDRPESLPQLGDVDLNGVRGRFGRIPGPQRLDDPVHGDDPAGLEREHREERARLLAAQRDRLAASLDLDRAEETYLELWGACPARSVHGVPRSSCAVAPSHGAPRISIPALSTP